MNAINDLAKELSGNLGQYGASELTYSVKLFSGEKSEKADIKGTISGREFRGIMFDASDELAIPCVSVHLSLKLNNDRIDDGHIAYWNTDNRFTKIYRHDDDDVFLVMDTFLTDADGGRLIQSVAKIWDMAVKAIPKFKIAYERHHQFQ